MEDQQNGFVPKLGPQTVSPEPSPAIPQRPPVRVFCTAEEYAFSPEGGEHAITLPSGKVFLLRYPRLAYKIKSVLVAQSIAARLLAEPGATMPDDEKIAASAKSHEALLCEVCVQPKVSLTPQKGELHPDRIDISDLSFIIRWAGGETDAQGNDLARFCGTKPAANASDGEGSAPVRAVAERAGEDAAVGTAV